MSAIGVFESSHRLPTSRCRITGIRHRLDVPLVIRAHVTPRNSRIGSFILTHAPAEPNTPA
jgi:hypothetical protein